MYDDHLIKNMFFFSFFLWPGLDTKSTFIEYLISKVTVKSRFSLMGIANMHNLHMQNDN